jgi:hypothetical protein
MNAVEIEEALSRLAEEPFDAESFPYAFLEAFGNKATTIQPLRSGNTNQSDITGGVLQRSNIHILATKEGELANGLPTLRSSPATSRQKCKFILATDGKTLEAENLRAANERNDETLKRIYIGRRFKNDTERLEKLFELYTQMISRQKSAISPKS